MSIVVMYLDYNEMKYATCIEIMKLWTYSVVNCLAGIQNC